MGIPLERANLLADVAEMYYLEGKNQVEIARSIGVTRSMVSRMLTEARVRGIVEVRIHRPLQLDHAIEASLIEIFNLRSVRVVKLQFSGDELLLNYLGKAGAEIVKEFLGPGMVLGIAWGTSLSAMVDQIELEQPLHVNVVQLVGALGARNNEYDGHRIVLRLAEKLGGEGYYLNAPFICSSPEVARSLMETPGVCETVSLGRTADLALLGIGSTTPKYSSIYLAGYIPLEDLDQLIQSGAIGDVCGLHFDIFGKEICDDFCQRLVTISKEDLLTIPTRITIAGGPGKAEPILGALRGGYVNALVTDSITAKKLLGLAKQVG